MGKAISGWSKAIDPPGSPDGRGAAAAAAPSAPTAYSASTAYTVTSKPVFNDHLGYEEAGPISERRKLLQTRLQADIESGFLDPAGWKFSGL